MPDLTPDRSARRPPPLGAREKVVRRGRRRRQRMLAAVGAAAVTLLLVPVAWPLLPGSGPDRLTVGDGAPAVTPTPTATPTASVSPPTASPSPVPAQPCPPSIAPNAPSLPAPTPPELAGALVPDEPPLAVTICRYADIAYRGYDQPPRPEQVALDGRQELRTGLQDLPGDLAVPPPAGGGLCTLKGGAVIPYLVQLRYAARTVWLSTSEEPNSCANVTNGLFTSGTYVGGQVAASFAAGGWVPAPRPDNAPATQCPTGPDGRAGQERDLVPDGWTQLVVCQSSPDGVQTARRLDDETAADVVALLRRLPTSPGEGFTFSCGQRPPDDGHVSLHVDYPVGRSVLVLPMPGCDPPLSNGSLSAAASPEEQAALLRLLEPRS